MLIFDENTMMKAKFNTSFVLCGGEYGVAPSDEGGNISETEYEFVETRTGQECWVFPCIVSEDYKGNAKLFVYIPEIDWATAVLAKFVTVGEAK